MGDAPRFDKSKPMHSRLVSRCSATNVRSRCDRNLGSKNVASKPLTTRFFLAELFGGYSVIPVVVSLHVLCHYTFTLPLSRMESDLSLYLQNNTSLVIFAVCYATSRSATVFPNPESFVMRCLLLNTTFQKSFVRSTRNGNMRAWTQCFLNALPKVPNMRSTLSAHALSFRTKQWCQLTLAFASQQLRMRSCQCNANLENWLAKRWNAFHTAAITVAGSTLHHERKRYNGPMTLRSGSQGITRMLRMPDSK